MLRPALTRLPVLCALALWPVSGCLVAAENPCDPDADPALQETGTLRGVVLDQDDSPLAGVNVVVTGRGDTTTTQEDGTFSFDELPPNPGITGYELVALPPEPLLGGRVTAPRLACQEEVDDVVLRVVVPPASPEVEIVQATAPDRLFVAFGSAGPDASYVVEVRAPFEVWQQASLAQDSWAFAEAAAGAMVGESAPEIDDSAAAAACSYFAYAHATLANDNARCAEVSGLLVDGEVVPLTTHGSYQVRVRAETPVHPGSIRQQLPERVRSPATSVPARTSLVPTAVLPVMMSNDVEVQASTMASMEVHAIVPTGNGRFAMVNGDGMAVIGLGEVVDTALADAAGAPTDAMVFDGAATTEANAEVAQDQGRAVAILPAGRWVRVWKERSNGVGGLSSQVEKVFVGAQDSTETHGVGGPEPEFALQVGMTALEGDFRGFDWLWIPSGQVRDEGYNPPDAYMLLFRSGFVMLERERLAEAIPAVLTGAFSGDLMDGVVDDEWALDDLDQPTGAQSGVCAVLGGASAGLDGNLGDRTTRVCYDLEAARGETLDLVASAILPSVDGDNARAGTFNLFVDRAGDRVFAVRTDLFLGEASGRLLDGTVPVRVGVKPNSVTVSRMLDCDAGTAQPVALVTNTGSLDVSVLEADATGVREITSLGVPGVPTGFLRDPDGVSCSDPFVWVMSDDGRMFPLDMRADRFGSPLCGEEPCRVDTRGRADTGGVSRNDAGTARVLIGGRGMLGELGFLRPAR